MIQVLEYITNNYTWFLCGAILILLAIIGYYADKTNFGQGKNLKDSKDKTNTISDANNEIQHDNNINELNKENDSITNEDQKNEVYDAINEQVELNQKDIGNDNNQTNVDEYHNVESFVDQEENDLNQINHNMENNNQYNEIESNNNSGATERTVGQNVVNIDNAQIISNQTQSLENYNTNNKVSKFSSIADEINSITTLPEQYLESNVEEILKAEEEFNKFDQEFNLFLPKKEVINTDLLSDIEELELDKTKKINLSDVPDLDNISLPKIKNLVADEQDIWKF